MNERSKPEFYIDPDAVDVTDEKFKEFLEMNIEATVSTAVGCKNFAPQLILYIRECNDTGMLGDIQVVVVSIMDNFNDAEHKRRIMEQVGAKMRADRLVPIAAFMSSEAWISVRDKDNPKMELPPSSDPNRKEVLMVSGRTFTGDCKAMAIIDVTRDSDDKVVIGKQEVTFDTKLINTWLLDYIYKGLMDLSIKHTPEFFKEANFEDFNGD